MFMLCGLPFAGKSTLARAIEDRFGMTRIEIDQVHRVRGLVEVEEADWQIAMQRSVRRLHVALGRGESVVWDSASLTRDQRDRIRLIAERYDANAHLIYVATSDDERQRRRRANLATRDRLDVTEPAMAEANRTFEEPGDDERPLRWMPEIPMAVWLEETIAPLIIAADVET